MEEASRVTAPAKLALTETVPAVLARLVSMLRVEADVVTVIAPEPMRFNVAAVSVTVAPVVEMRLRLVASVVVVLIEVPALRLAVVASTAPMRLMEVPALMLTVFT